MSVSRASVNTVPSRRRLSLFIGADLSSEVTGLPPRTELAQGLAKRHGLDGALSLAEVAQRVSREGHRFEFTDFLRKALGPSGISPQPFHDRLAHLVEIYKVRTIVTTAYDDLLESALKNRGIAFNRVVHSSDVHFVDPDQLTVVKLYGDLQYPDSLIVTDRDHLDLLRDRDREGILDEVRRVFRQDTVMFVGYNLADPDFRFVFDQVAESRFSRTAYAVWPGLPESDVQMWRDRGIAILPTDPWGVLGDDVSPIVGDPSLEPELPVTVSAAALSLVRQLHVQPSPSQVLPPTESRQQELPFNDLTWEQFEALCAALIEANPATVDCHLFGVRGDFQEGIDIVAVQRGASGEHTWAYQCKRHKDYSPGELKTALAEIRYQADYHVLMLSIPATASMRQVCRGLDNTFLWDGRDIARKLKKYPTIVEDFFGTAWRQAFCG